MSNATSIVGTWSGFVAWGDSGPPVSDSSTLWTFHADGAGPTSSAEGDGFRLKAW